MIDLEQLVNQIYQTPSDINEHVPTLIKYGTECDHITEMGVRGIVSTWVFLGCSPKKLISYDIENPSKWGGNINLVYETARNYDIEFKFIQQDVKTVDIEKTDLLFLDTWHVYEQVKNELQLHSPKVQKYIIFHDTTLYATHGETSGHVGIWPAIEEFLSENKQWLLLERYTNNNGLTVLKRTS